MYGTGSNRSRIASFVLAASLAGGVAAVLACSPGWIELVTVTSIDPPDRARFDRGELGVVRPRFRRSNLLQAYRVLSGRPPLSVASTPQAPPESSVDAWFKIAGSAPADFSRERSGPNFMSFLNCNDKAFENAVNTYRDRARQFGATAAETREWVAGQKAVFNNCDRHAAFPPNPPANASPIVRADRAYHLAAAYFYARDYGEAEKRFRAIALDLQSPWRAYGRFLAARSIIREVTTPDTPNLEAAQREAAELHARQRFETAERDLQAVLADPAAASLHRSARRLIAFIANRTRPIARLHELSARLTRDATVSLQDLTDYVYLMDHLVGNAVAFQLRDDIRSEIAGDDDFVAWLLAMQDTSPDIDWAVRRWRSRPSSTMLIAVMWHIARDHEATAELLTAAAAVPRESPAFATLAFLRVRLLIEQGRVNEARQLLASLPETPGNGMSPETLNLLNGARLKLAQSLDEFLTYAPREFVVTLDQTEHLPVPKLPVLDGDSAAVFTSRMPLELLVASAESTRLPTRLRARIAGTAFTRAVVLKRDALGLRAAAVLASIAPALRSDLQQYVDARDATSRHRAGLITMLRTPGLHAYVRGWDDEHTFRQPELRRTLDSLHDNWWCEKQQPVGHWPVATEAMQLLSRNLAAPEFPAFVSDDERTATAQERSALDAAGSARSYLASETLAWAADEPKNPVVAEALARVVKGWRVGCGDDDKWPLARRAFQTLHRNFPDDDWATQTKYWYRD